MKKTLSLILALVMMLSLCTAAFADDNTINQGTTDNSGTTEVVYNLSNGTAGNNDSYIVTIPANVTVGLDNNAATLTVAATEVRVLNGKHLDVTLENSDGFFLIRIEGNIHSSIEYTVKNGTDFVESDDVVLTVAGKGWLAVADGDVDLAVATTTFNVNQALLSGQHSDTITFKCEVN